jgi:hypothetical protein
MTSDTDISVDHNIQHVTISRRGLMSGVFAVLKFRIVLHQKTVTVSHVKGLKQHYTKMGFYHSDHLKK